MFDKLRDKLQDKRDDFKENRLEFQDNVANRFGFNSTQNDPASNGTGSARGNFGQFAQNAIGRIRQGGMALFGEHNPWHQSADPNAAQTMTTAPCPPTTPQSPMPTSHVRQWNPTTGASASAKKIAKKAAKQYVAENRLTGDEAKEVVKNAKKTQSFSKESNPHADRKAGGAKNKNVNFGGSMNGGPGDGRKKPTANTLRSDATRYEIPGKQQMKGEFAGLERRPANVDYPNMSKSDQRDIDYGRMKNEWLAKTSHEDHGFYSDSERAGQASSLGWDMVSRPGPLNKTGQTIAKGPKKPKAKPQSGMKMMRSVKGIEPKKKLMATKTAAKAKAPLKKMTPRPAKKL